MKISVPTIFGLGSLLFLVLATLFSTQLVITTQAYKNAREIYAQQLNYEKRLLDFEEWLEADTGRNKQKIAQENFNQAIENSGHANFALWGFIVLSACYLFFVFSLARRKHYALAIPGGLIILGLACLEVGLFAPMLEIGAFQRDMSIPIKIKTGLFSLSIDRTATFHGDLYFYYQSKSVMELIGLLFRQHNFVVGASILIFSVLFPLSKISLTLLHLFQPHWIQNKWANFMIQKSGKWSMADVFVVALFLGFLAFNNMQTGIQTESSVLIGLYFFLAYVVLSILSSFWVEPGMRKES
ncbi:MAG: hypothetical protein DHS20C18_43220 [Saprospiraceae bacterium]|nr:MAG: hypothetical protein DHS20C18_43220 [Saprospiraceae bacterium]